LPSRISGDQYYCELRLPRLPYLELIVKIAVNYLITMTILLYL